MFEEEKIDLGNRIILHGNQGVNGHYLKDSLACYLSHSRYDFKKIEAKPQSSLSFRELQLLVGRNILRKVHTYLEETNFDKVVHYFPLYLFSVWYNESLQISGFGHDKGMSLIPYVRFKNREDILMSTLCRQAVKFSYEHYYPSNGIGEWCVNYDPDLRGYILSDDIWDWVHDRVKNITIPGAKRLGYEFDKDEFGSFYLWDDAEFIGQLSEELELRRDESLSRFKDETTDGLKVEYHAEGDFNEETGCLEWKIKEEPSVKDRCGATCSSIFKRWIGLSSNNLYRRGEGHFSGWLDNKIVHFDPFAFDAGEYKEQLKSWL